MKLFKFTSAFQRFNKNQRSDADNQFNDSAPTPFHPLSILPALAGSIILKSKNKPSTNRAIQSQGFVNTGINFYEEKLRKSGKLDEKHFPERVLSIANIKKNLISTLKQATLEDRDRIVLQDVLCKDILALEDAIKKDYPTITFVETDYVELNLKENWRRWTDKANVDIEDCQVVIKKAVQELENALMDDETSIRAQLYPAQALSLTQLKNRLFSTLIHARFSYDETIDLKFTLRQDILALYSVIREIAPRVKFINTKDGPLDMDAVGTQRERALKKCMSNRPVGRTLRSTRYPWPTPNTTEAQENFRSPLFESETEDQFSSSSSSASTLIDSPSITKLHPTILRSVTSSTKASSIESRSFFNKQNSTIEIHPSTTLPSSPRNAAEFSTSENGAEAWKLGKQFALKNTGRLAALLARDQHPE